MNKEHPDTASDLRDRKHPHRLPSELYRMPEQEVFVTLCSRWGTSLAQPDVAKGLVLAMGRVGGQRKVKVHAYCIMPDHVHILCSALDENGDLQGWIRYVKRGTAKALNAPGMWQRSYWDRHVRRDQGVLAAVEYMLDNPVRSGLRETWQEWPYCWSEWHDETIGENPNLQA